jgi:hypothetical protein
MKTHRIAAPLGAALVACASGAEHPVAAGAAQASLFVPARGASVSPAEGCAALARGMAGPSPSRALEAALLLVAAPCGDARSRALDAIEARVQRGPLPALPNGRSNLLALLCQHDVEIEVRSIEVLRSIARSPREALPMRSKAMEAVKMCAGGGWFTLSPVLRRDPDPAVREAAADVDSIVIRK